MIWKSFPEMISKLAKIFGPIGDPCFLFLAKDKKRKAIK
jgi:hypothetical protein